jgi:hypothetical protein
MAENLPTITKARAMSLCEKIREGMGSVAEMVAELHDNQGWSILGYDSWKDCVEKEFHHPAWWAKRQAKIAAVRKMLPPPPESPKQGANLLPKPPLRDSHLEVLATVPEEKREAVLEWAQDKAGDKPPTAKIIKEAIKEVMEAEPEDPTPIPGIVKAVEVGKFKATDAQLQRLADFDEETQEAMLVAFLAGRQTVAEAIESGCAAEPTLEEEIKAQASEIEHACRAIMKVVKEEVEKLTTPWLSYLNYRAGAMQKFQDATDTLRAAKCVAPCPKCSDGCAKCLKTGMVTKYVQQQLT